MTTVPTAVKPSEGSPAATPSGPANVVDKVARFIERFVFIKDKSIYRFLALWVIHTHCHDEFDYTGYLFVHSPEKGCGKTRLLEILNLLVLNPSGILGNVTEAVVFRTAHGATQLFDEVDTWTNREFLRSILNAGYSRGGKVPRMEGNGKGKFKPVEFEVFAPRALAGIGLANILEDSLRDRGFVIRMLKQTKHERSSQRFRKRNVEPEAVQLKAEIAAWVKQRRICQGSRLACPHIREIYSRGESTFPYLSDLDDRTIDVAEPFAAILEVAYAGLPELDERRMELLEAIGLTREEGKEFLRQKILRELRRLAETEDPLVGNASELAAKCTLIPRPGQYEISQTLRAYGFTTRSIRVGKESRRRYELRHEELADLCNRFDSSSPGEDDADNGERFPNPLDELFKDVPLVSVDRVA